MVFLFIVIYILNSYYCFQIIKFNINEIVVVDFFGEIEIIIKNIFFILDVSYFKIYKVINYY